MIYIYIYILINDMWDVFINVIKYNSIIYKKYLYNT